MKRYLMLFAPVVMLCLAAKSPTPTGPRVQTSAALAGIVIGEQNETTILTQSLTLTEPKLVQIYAQACFQAQQERPTVGVKLYLDGQPISTGYTFTDWRGPNETPIPGSTVIQRTLQLTAGTHTVTVTANAQATAMYNTTSKTLVGQSGTYLQTTTY